MPPDMERFLHLERDSSSSYRQMCVRGRRIRARTLYGQYVNRDDPRSVEDIAADYDLPIAAVQEAISYCQSDPSDIADDSHREEISARAAGEEDSGYRYRPTPAIFAKINKSDSEGPSAA